MLRFINWGLRVWGSLAGGTNEELRAKFLGRDVVVPGPEIPRESARSIELLGGTCQRPGARVCEHCEDRGTRRCHVRTRASALEATRPTQGARDLAATWDDVPRDSIVRPTSSGPALQSVTRMRSGS